MSDELRERLIGAVERHLRDNDECGPGPVSDQEYHDDAAAIVTTILVIQKRACDHDWVDARNEVVTSGEYCSKCRTIRAGNEATA